jgi:hypothetical protein
MAAQAGSGSDPVIGALQHRWGEMYDIDWDTTLSQYRARRNDGTPGMLADAEPDGLVRLLTVDCQFASRGRRRPACGPGPSIIQPGFLFAGLWCASGLRRGTAGKRAAS